LVAFANIDALVADQTGTTLTPADANLLLVLVRKMLILDDKTGPILLGSIDVVDNNGAVPGDVRVSVARAADDNPVLSVKVLSLGKVEVEVSADRDGASERLQRATFDAVFSFA